ncbi:nuclear transport factor 2 family protein [Streptomyces sp. NPDC001970]
MSKSLTDIGNRYMELVDVAPNDPQAFDELIGMFAEDVYSALFTVASPIPRELHGREALAEMYRGWYETGPAYKHLWNATVISDDTIELPYVFALRFPDGKLAVSGGTDWFKVNAEGLIYDLRNETKLFVGL